MKHSSWYYHNKALREHPEYQMEGMLDCLREEMMLNMPYPKEVFEYPKRVTQKEPWTKKQWDVVNQLRLDQVNLRNTLYRTLKEIKAASASKRRPKYI